MLPASAGAGRVAQLPHRRLERGQIAAEGTDDVRLDAVEVRRERLEHELAALGREHRLEPTTVAGAGGSLDVAGGLEPVDEPGHAAGAEPGALGQVGHAQVLARGAG